MSAPVTPPMPVLSVIGTSNNSGKTLLACQIVRRGAGRWQALKVSTIYNKGGNCPRDTDTGDCACRQLDGAIKVVADPQVLSAPDTDTGDLWAAGARPLRWGLALVGYHDRLWEALAPDLDPARPLVTEGNQIAALLRATVRILACNPLRRNRWKADAESNLETADLVLLNPYARGRWQPEHPEVAPLVRRLGARAVLFDPARPTEEWPARLATLVDRVGGAAVAS